MDTFRLAISTQISIVVITEHGCKTLLEYFVLRALTVAKQSGQVKSIRVNHLKLDGIGTGRDCHIYQFFSRLTFTVVIGSDFSNDVDT